jgi:hypothetical protein
MPLPHSGVGGTLMTSPPKPVTSPVPAAPRAAALQQETLFGIAPERLTGAVPPLAGSTPAPAAVAPAHGPRGGPARPSFGAGAPVAAKPMEPPPLAQRTLAGVMPDDMARAVAAARERAAARPQQPTAHAPSPMFEPAAPREPARREPVAAAPLRREPPRAEPAQVEVPRSPAPAVPLRTVFEPNHVPEVGTARSVAPEAEPQGYTHLGVAIPGVAPLRTATSAPPGPAAPRAHEPELRRAPPAPRAPSRIEETRLEPNAAGPSLSSLSSLSILSIRPVLPRSAFVLLGSGLVLLIAAAAFALLWKGHKPLSVSISADPSGKDRLDIVCEECPDGTRLSLGPSEAELSGRKAYIALPEPLPLGESHASFGVQKPGEDEPTIVELTLPPVEYRIVPDIGTLVGDQPKLTLKVAALPGSKVEIAGQPVALDAAGQGESGIDMTAQLLGPASTITTIEQSIPFAITPPSGRLYEGQLAFKIGVTPLMLEAPGADTVTNLERFMLAGRTSKGAELWVAGSTIAVDDAGRFAQLMSIDSVGETRVTVRATGPGLAPRFASFRLQRVESLAAEASARRQKARPLAQVTKNIADHVGSTVVVSGRIEEVRVDGHRTLVILQSEEGCQSRVCLSRLVYGGLRKLARGETVTAIGRLLGAVGGPGANGGEVPEVDVSLLL